MIKMREFKRLKPRITAPHHPIQDNEIIEGNHQGAHYKLTHDHMPLMGNLYHLSVSGPATARQAVISRMQQLIGKPPEILDEIGEITHVHWASGDTTIPDSITVHNLGKERIEAITREHGVEDDFELLLEILAAYDFFYGDMPARVAFMQHRVGGLPEPRRTNITKALLQATIE